MNPILIADFKTGFENVKDAYLLDNTAFPVLQNAWVRRSKVRRKIGSTLLCRGQRDFVAVSIGNSGASPWSFNIYTVLGLESTSQIAVGSVTINVGAIEFTDNSDGTLSSVTAGNSGTIDYSTGDIVLTHTAGAGVASTITMSYYPGLPIMGLESFYQVSDFPLLVGFDTKYSYQINQANETFYDTTFYSTSGVHFTWSGEDYQQFYSMTWKDSLWVTNGKPGFHFKDIEGMPVVGAISQFTITGHGLETNDWVYINQIDGVTDVNDVSGQITKIDANTFSLPTPGAAGAYVSGGIAQYLTNSTSSTADGIRYYMGDPIANVNLGWVNFAPPLSSFDATNNPFPFYLIGADIVVTFKDRVLFFGCYYRKSNDNQVYFSNRMTYSQNGTPYYHSLIPANQTSDPKAWYQNIPAKGGFLDAPVEQQIINVNNQEDVLICAFESSTRRLIFTGDDSFPFIYQGISSDFGGGHTFSSVSLEDSVVFAGNYGWARATQTSLERIDLMIPDEIFQIQYIENGLKRVCATRDFRNELIYFSVPIKDNISKFPSRTYIWNYRENNWAYFEENYTHYGSYQKTTFYTWATLPYRTWAEWLVPWNFGGPGERFPSVIAGNQQGFVLLKDDSTLDGYSHYISSISGNVITSPNHGVNDGDFIQITGMAGDIAGELPDNIIQKASNITENDFQIEITTTESYIGGATFRILPNFNIVTKAFAPYWNAGRKTRFAPSRYLIDAAKNGQVTINFFTSQVGNDSMNSLSDYLVYSGVLLTGKEPRQDLQIAQNQIWHRMNNPAVGDSIQIQFSLSDDQMRDEKINGAIFNLCAIYLETHPAGFI